MSGVLTEDWRPTKLTHTNTTDEPIKTQQRAALQEAMEGLKGELAEAKEAGEAAAKDAARAAQVLSDLGEQVRSYVCICASVGFGCACLCVRVRIGLS